MNDRHSEKREPRQSEDPAMNLPDRRGFLRRVAAGATGAAALGLGWSPEITRGESLSRESKGSAEDAKRSQRAEKLRVDAAKLAERRPQQDHPNNGEET